MSLRRFLSKVLGNANERELQQMQPLVDAINGLETEYEALSDTQLRAKTDEFVHRLGEGETLDDILVEAFACVREASKRTTGLRHYDVQLLGGIALHRGYALEMKTGEGKTLVATLPLYLNALSGKGCHLITVNDYLARRDVQWMGPIYHRLGLGVGLLQQGENRAFVFAPDFYRPSDDSHLLRAVKRQEAYGAHITYGTNNEFGFDYLRDNSARSLKDRVQRGFHYAIVDEVDNILIDEARTPLIISGPATAPTDEYYHLAKAVRQLTPEDYEIDERTRNITLTDAGYDHVERLLKVTLFDPDYPDETTPQQTRLLHHLEQALKAEYTMRRNHEYIVQSGRVVIVDEFTGRTMPGRRWSDGLHQAVEAKENLPVQQENITYATITLQNYFRMYDRLAGMTGTAATEAEEFDKVYDLRVLILPPNRRIIREDAPDVVLRSQEGKFRAIVQDIVSAHCLGRPVLVGTASVEVSERLSERLGNPLLSRWASAVLIRDGLNSSEVDSATYREDMQALNQPLESLSASQLRELGTRAGVSGRLTSEENLWQLARLLGAEDTSCLADILSQGAPHNVLNARHHTDEARIVARAGEVGAVTIATNMAGRGVDIKLGGELDNELSSGIRDLLRRNGISPYELSFVEMAEALRKLDPSTYGLKTSDMVREFLAHVEAEERVKALGGLHVIGTERHEARRIDNQLRGRSGRQGDPGSSRFYLSLEDDLMRRFGGDRVAGLIDRLGAEDDVPLALGIVSKAIANAQTQVEGHNFDIRKHLLEYDDVLNTQREVMYEQRRQILSKQDLRDDVWAMVEAEVRQRVDDAWFGETPDLFRLVHYLEQVQPTTVVAEGKLFPSFSLKRVLSTLPIGDPPQEMRDALSKVIADVLASQRPHVLESAESSIERALDSERTRVDRLLEIVATAYEGAEAESEEREQELSPRSAARAVARGTGLEIDVRELGHLRGQALEQALMDRVRTLIQAQARTWMWAYIQARLDLELTIDRSSLVDADERTLLGEMLNAVEEAWDRHVGRTTKEVEREIEAHIRHPEDCAASNVTRFLQDVRFGTRTQFDRRHRRISQTVQRFRFTAWVADQIANWDRERLETEILDHLQAALTAWEDAWGGLETQRIGAYRWANLDDETRDGLRSALGEEQFANLADTPVSDLPADAAQRVRAYLGQRVLFNVQRQLMLDTTSRYWVEHLTAMEVLRQGIGLQSYGQRDPLAEYKVRAYDMFQELLEAIRSDIITDMFRYRPRDLSQVRVGVQRKAQSEPSPTGEPSRARPSSQRSGRKPRRRRKRRQA